MPRDHVHQQVYNRCQEAASLSTLTLTFSYTNMVLSTTRGDNELRRAFTTAPASENIEGPYVQKEHLSLVWPRCTALEMQNANLLYVSVWLLHQPKGSSVWTPIQRYCWISRSREWSWKCRIVAASLVLPFSVTEQSNHYFHWLMLSRRRPGKLRCIDWWSDESEPTFWPKTGGALVKLRRPRRAVLAFPAVPAPQLFRRWRGGATGVRL